MTPERWQRVKTLFHAALERPADERAGFLGEACGDDAEVRAHLERLLDANAAAGSFLETPATPEPAARPLLTGRRFAHYELGPRVGVGGMGEVYRAHDAKLGRDVAIKVLPPAFTADPGRLAGFEREARVLASLNHPHIASIHGVEESDGIRALVLELAEGETLADILQRTGASRRSSLRLQEALGYAHQIADALEAAHEKGITHRDLKPANVAITPDGVVKLLDFGIAKVVTGEGRGVDLSHTAHTKIEATHAGLIVGTAGYMSPEQARGKPVDKRTDIWAFGCVFYEMLSRRRAFAGETLSDTITAILDHEPDWSLLPNATPPTIRRLIRRCLEKDPRQRLRDIGDARLELEQVLRGDVESADDVSRQQARSWQVMFVVGAALVSAALTGLLTWALMPARPPVPASASRFAVVLPSTLLLRTVGYFRGVTVSPDGRSIVYVSNGDQLVLRTLDRLDLQPLPGIRSRHAPYFSPDSQSIAFIDGANLKRVAIGGGPITTLGQSLGAISDGYWSDEGTIIFSTEFMGLRSLPAAGGEVTTLTSLDPAQNEIHHSSPWALPERRGILFTNWARVGDVEPQIAVLDLRTGRRKTVLRGGFAPAYIDTGHVIYQAGGTLFVVPFDLESLEVTGEPVRQDLSVPAVAHLGLIRPAYALSRTGTLVIVPGEAETHRLVWVDRQGRETALNTPLRTYEAIRLSPDATRAAITMADDRDIWVWDFARDALTRLTFGASVGWVPVWMPDGRQILYTSNHAGSFNLYRRNADGSGAGERLTTSTNSQVPNSVTPDGATILGAEAQATTGWDVVKFVASPREPSSGSATPSALFQSDDVVATPHAEFAANISPDGRFFAYQSFESGRPEIYVRPYPGVNLGRWQVSTDGGNAPVWARSGRELFFLDASNRLMAVPVQTADARFTQGKAARVLDTAYWGVFYSYDVSPDGQRFLMIKRSRTPNQDAAASSIEVILHWVGGLKARVPAR